MKELLEAIWQQVNTDYQPYEDLFSICKETMKTDVKLGIAYLKKLSDKLEAVIPATEDADKIHKFFSLHKRVLLVAAPHDFESYLLYVEWGREPEKKFYPPRRMILKQVVDALQRLADGELDLLAISLPPGTGKTTLAIFYLTWLGGRVPDKPMLTGSHSNSFVRGVYDECLRIFEPNGEYLWHDVFPDINVVNTNAKDCRIDLGKRKRFETLEFTSIGTGNAGLYRAATLLYCDDLVSGIEVALSKERLDKLWETYELSHSAAMEQRIELESAAKAARRVTELKREISGLGTVNVGAIEEFQRVNERYTYLTGQRDDVEQAKGELEGIIEAITREMTAIFAQQFELIAASFRETYLQLFGGGRATLELEDPSDVLNCGIEIKVQPPGKTLKTLSLLSGGEKAFVAIALYFAILKVHPTPFFVMDEVEAALDEANVVRVARYMRSISDKTQFIVITHRRGTMEEADVLYGVTMQEKGVSRMLAINMNEMAEELDIQ